jgi:hypothetical protein
MKKILQKKEGVSAGKVVTIGAGIAALAAATYYFFGPEGKKNQKSVKGWMIKMKGEIIDKMEDAKEVSESAYHEIVDSVGAKYLKAKKVTPEDVGVYVDTLKKQWKGISKSVLGTKKKVAKKVVRVATQK